MAAPALLLYSAMTSEISLAQRVLANSVPFESTVKFLKSIVVDASSLEARRIGSSIWDILGGKPRYHLRDRLCFAI